jgi:hypothetical protein
MILQGSGYYNEVLPPNTGEAISFAESCSTTAIEVKNGSNRLEQRRGVFLQNRSDVVILWGFSSSSCVIPLSAESTSGSGDGGRIFIDVGDQQSIYVKTASGSSKTLACAEIK